MYLNLVSGVLPIVKIVAFMVVYVTLFYAKFGYSTCGTDMLVE